MQYYKKVSSLILGSFILLTYILNSCQKENINQNSQKQTAKNSTKISMLRDTALENDKSLMRVLDNAEAKKQDSRANKTVYNAQYDFTINTDYAKVITNANGTNNYTFGVYREEDNGLLENLLLKEQIDGTFLVYLVQYDVSETERSTLANQEIVNMENKITYVPLEDISSSVFDKVNSTAETCTVFSYEWQEASTCGAGGNHTFEDGGYSETNPTGCRAWGNPDFMATSGGYVLTSNEIDCTDGSNSGYEYDDNNNNNNNNNQSSGYGSEGGGNGGENPDTAIVFCTQDCADEDDKCFLSDEDFNAPFSANSPFNVDLGEVRRKCDTIDPPENKKFLCIYKKLTNSPKFKDLFIDTFGESVDLNVIFKVVPSIAPVPPSTTTPNAKTSVRLDLNSTNPLGAYNGTIYISSAYMEATSAISVAKTIMHECIHAFLTIKQYGCNQGTEFDEYDDVELSEILNQYYSTACPNQSDHEFMFDYLLPTMSEILEDIKDDLIPLSHQEGVADILFINESNPNEQTPWNWDDFYKYLSMDGLQNSDAFEFEMLPESSVKYQNFSTYVNHGRNSFRKTCID